MSHIRQKEKRKHPDDVQKFKEQIHMLTSLTFSYMFICCQYAVDVLKINK